MINASDFRNGVTIELDDGNVYSVVEFLHVKPGKGSAFVRTKIKNVMTGGVVERTFNPTDKVQRAIIETKELEYLYNDGTFYYLMDNETFEQLPLEEEQMHDALPYITENMTVTVRFFKGKAFSVAAPNFVELTITECEPGVRGDTATNATKVAKLETGYEVNVPLFINEGEKIQIDTRTGEYMGRA